MATQMGTDVVGEAVQRLAKGLQPERIYLFGSQARGEAGAGSDIDLLVVLSHSDLPRHKREAHSYNLLWGMTQSVDVIVLTQAEFERSSQVTTSLASTVLREGKLVYG